MAWKLSSDDRRHLEELLATKGASDTQIRAWRRLFDGLEAVSSIRRGLSYE